LVCLLTGTGLAATGLGCFLLPNHFIDGGATGISMLLANLTGIPLAIVLVVVNTPFIGIARRHLGLEFAIKTGIGIAVLALCVGLIPFPIATEDKLLGSVFGGIFIGAGVGLAIRHGGVLDGTEILAVILSKRTFATVGEVILGLNVIIFAVAALFLGVEPALYSVLTYLAASKTIDYLIHGIEAYNGVMITSTQHDLIRQAILNEMGRGVTAFKATGGYSQADQEVLMCVVTRLEITRLETLVKVIDANAFIVVLSVNEASGGVMGKRIPH
jgi:uncharacterized membrane-anchored protein YitT (DUF2179 family)